jgi:hypothetical protein
MKDVHGERIRTAELIAFLSRQFDGDQELLIMVGADGPDGSPGEAALMAWGPDGPSPLAINVPVFTRMPEFYEQIDAPSVTYADGRGVAPRGPSWPTIL